MEPPWGGVASELPYELEILKNGAIVDTLPLTRSSYFVVGRLPVCDVSLEHPSISRYHGVLQCRGRCGGEDGYGEEDEEGGSSSSSSCSSEAKGFYIHDLGSTHGTVVNKNKIPPQDGPEFDEERESELTVTELREHSRKERAELERRMMGEGSDDDDGGDDNDENEVKDDGTTEGEGGSDKKRGKGKKADSGCSWGDGGNSRTAQNGQHSPAATQTPTQGHQHHPGPPAAPSTTEHHPPRSTNQQCQPHQALDLGERQTPRERCGRQ
ncbi:hypothetical protein CRUP_010749 [Coryphaenoides rupestris]|nr:hypothetical protein CRUP_010749 [Coryphaenoides rupestris]